MPFVPWNTRCAGSLPGASAQPSARRNPTIRSMSVQASVRKLSCGAATAGVLDLEPVHRHEALLGLGVDVRDDLDVGLEAAAPQLRLQEAVDLEEPGRIVHPDLDQ